MRTTPHKPLTAVERACHSIAENVSKWVTSLGCEITPFMEQVRRIVSDPRPFRLMKGAEAFAAPQRFVASRIVTAANDHQRLPLEVVTMVAIELKEMLEEELAGSRAMADGEALLK